MQLSQRLSLSLTHFLLAALALVSFANLTAEAQQRPSLQSPEFQDWRATMHQTPLPHSGCFKASYPVTEWREVTCAIAPSFPLQRARRLGKSNTVGDGYDYSAVSSSLITQAEGSFPTVNNVTSSNTYSLQLNSSPFTTSVCSGAENPSSCQGWQQFVFESTGSLYMQYWLLDWGKSCPSGWTEYTNGSEIDCYKNSSAASPTTEPIGNLGLMTLTGKASGGTDTVLFDSPNGDVSATGADTVLNLEKGWYDAEFNVFGYCCAEEVSLNAAASLVVQTSLTNGTTTEPGYTTEGFTGETNNLTLAGTAPCRYGGTTPIIQFLESNVPGASATCGPTAIVPSIPLECTAAPTCSLQGSGPGEVVAGQVPITCTQDTLLTASATICGNSCVTNSAAPPEPISYLNIGDATPGTAGSCSFKWSWGGNNYSQSLNVN